MAPLVAAGIAQGVGGLIKLISGAKQKKEGKGILKNIGEEVVPQDILDNQVMAKQRANQGLPSQQYANAMKNIQRQQLMALRGAGDRRGGLAAISTLNQSGNDAMLNLDAADAEQKIANERQLMQVNNQVGGWKNKIWERKYNYGMDLLGAGNQNQSGAFDDLGAGLGTALYGGAADGLFGGKKTPTYSSVGVQGGDTYTGRRNYTGYRG